MRLLVPLCVLLGASFVLFCDTLGRVIAAPYELPAGIILSFVGGPFFLYLLLGKKGGTQSPCLNLIPFPLATTGASD
ncbi:MAG: iron chelate uptake ABC transporter family permease subunit [Roseburia sp.]